MDALTASRRPHRHDGQGGAGLGRRPGSLASRTSPHRPEGLACIARPWTSLDREKEEGREAGSRWDRSRRRLRPRAADIALLSRPEGDRWCGLRWTAPPAYASRLSQALRVRKLPRGGRWGPEVPPCLSCSGLGGGLAHGPRIGLRKRERFKSSPRCLKGCVFARHPASTPGKALGERVSASQPPGRHPTPPLKSAQSKGPCAENIPVAWGKHVITTASQSSKELRQAPEGAASQRDGVTSARSAVHTPPGLQPPVAQI